METDTWSNRILTPCMSAIVKNTFVNVVDSFESDRTELRRSASDGDLSKSSGESQPEQVVGYFLPSLWSSSNSSEKRGTTRSLENAPWLWRHAEGASIPFPALPSGVSSSSRPEPLGVQQSGPPLAARLIEPLAAEYEPSSADLCLSDGMPLGATLNRFKPAQPGTRSTELNASPSAASSAEPGLDKQASHPVTPGVSGQADAPPDPPELITLVHAELRGRLTLEKVEELGQAGLLSQIPRNATNELSSVGSINHLQGICTPCAYWFKGICKYGISCHYCHFAHSGQKSKRLRPSKQTRMRIRRWEQSKAAEGSEQEGGDGDEGAEGQEDCISMNGDPAGQAPASRTMYRFESL